MKDLLITMPCKSSIIHEHKSKPNTGKTGKMCCNTVHTHTHSAHISKQCSTFMCTIHTYCTNKPSCCFSSDRLTTVRSVAEKKEALGLQDKPLSFADEQVRKTAPVPDYTVSRRATNPALAIHPVLCADLLTNGQMPMTHFPVAFLLVRFPASGNGGFTSQKRSKHYS